MKNQEYMAILINMSGNWHFYVNESRALMIYVNIEHK